MRITGIFSFILGCSLLYMNKIRDYSIMGYHIMSSNKELYFNQRINIFSSITKHLTLIAIKWSKLWYWFCGLQMSKLIDEGVIVLKVQNFLFKLVYLVCIKWESYLENFILLHWRVRTLQPWSWEICLKRDFCNSCSLIWWDLCWSIWLLHVHHYLLCYLHQFPYRWKLCTRIGSIVLSIL